MPHKLNAELRSVAAGRGDFKEPPPAGCRLEDSDIRSVPIYMYIKQYYIKCILSRRNSNSSILTQNHFIRLLL